MKPLISVIMPVKDCGPFVEQAAQSILDQEHSELELIIIEGESSDDTSERLRNLKDSRIVLHRRPDLDFCSALNFGIECSRGDFIARQDGDDIALPPRLRDELQFLTEHQDVVLVGSAWGIVDPDGLLLRTLRYPTTHESLVSVLGEGLCPFGHSTVLIRKRGLLAVGGYDSFFKKSEDFELWLRLSRVARLHNLPSVLQLIRYRTDSASRGCFPLRINYPLVAQAVQYIAAEFREDIRRSPGFEDFCARLTSSCTQHLFYAPNYHAYVEAQKNRYRAKSGILRHRYRDAAQAAYLSLRLDPLWLPKKLLGRKPVLWNDEIKSIVNAVYRSDWRASTHRSDELARGRDFAPAE